MLVACTTATEGQYTSSGVAMRRIFGSSSTAVVGTTGEIDDVDAFVTAASRWADGEINGHGDAGEIQMQVYSESLPAYGGRELVLSRTPLIRVLRMFDSTSTDDATEYCSTDFQIRSHNAGIIERQAGYSWTADQYLGASDFNLGLTPAFRPGQLARPWLVEYVAGYITTGTTATCHGRTTADETWTTGPTLPGDLAQAVALRAAEVYVNPMGVKRRKVGDLDVTYETAGPSTSGAASILTKYKRIAL